MVLLIILLEIFFLINYQNIIILQNHQLKQFDKWLKDENYDTDGIQYDLLMVGKDDEKCTTNIEDGLVLLLSSSYKSTILNIINKIKNIINEYKDEYEYYYYCTIKNILKILLNQLKNMKYLNLI